MNRAALVTAAERASVILGALLIVIAIASFDWRLGLGVAGLLLVSAGIDTRRRP